MLRALSTALCLLTAPAAHALCEGPLMSDSFSPEQSASLEAAIAATPYNQGIYWQATRGPDQISIIGTVHIYDPRLEAISDRLTPVIAAADILLVEADAAEQAEMQSAMATDTSLFLITEGPTLIDLLPPDKWQTLATAATDRGVPPFMIAKMQPWFAMLTLAIPPCAMAEMAQGRMGLDHMLMTTAEMSDVPTQSLEPWNTAFDLLSQGTMDDQLDMLMVSLGQDGAQAMLLNETLEAYFAQEVARIWEVSRIASTMTDVPAEEGLAAYAELEELLLNNRNRNWMPHIAQAAQDHDDIVIAVGAAHLIGEQGILSLLAAEGWTLTRIE